MYLNVGYRLWLRRNFKYNIATIIKTFRDRCLARELFIHYGGKWIRRVRLDEHPLQLLYRFLRELGHSSARRMQLIGLKEDLAPLFKFVGGSCIMVDVKGFERKG